VVRGASLKKITRKEAKAADLKRYYTGKACKWGHLAERHVSDRQCVECHRSQNRMYGASDKGAATARRYKASAKGLAARRRYCASEAAQAASRRYAASEKGISRNRRYRERNRDAIKARQLERRERLRERKDRVASRPEPSVPPLD